MSLAADRGQNLGSMTARLLALLDQVGPSELEAAIVDAVACNLPTVGAVRQVLDRRLTERGLPPPVTIRVVSERASRVTVRNHDLASYDLLNRTDDNAQED